VTFECETVEVKRFAPGVPDGGNLIIGRVVYLHVDDGVLDERARIDPARLEAVGRMGGASYCTTRDRLEIPRGRAALGG
jgi:flavin reductase (DIM6/NTAB) family NADH-FMN oxidoreductase RutF